MTVIAYKQAADDVGSPAGMVARRKLPTAEETAAGRPGRVDLTILNGDDEEINGALIALQILLFATGGLTEFIELQKVGISEQGIDITALVDAVRNGEDFVPLLMAMKNQS